MKLEAPLAAIGWLSRLVFGVWSGRPGTGVDYFQQRMAEMLELSDPHRAGLGEPLD